MLTALLALWTAAAPAPAFAPKARLYDALHYRIEFRLLEGGAFENTVTLRLKPKRALATVELDSRGLKILSAQVDGKPATVQEKPDQELLIVKPAQSLAAGKDATVELKVSGKAGTAHAGLFQVQDAKGTWTYSHFESSSARAFFPCNDQPDDKATTELFAVVDGKLQVLSNGRKEKDETFAEGGKNLRRVHWVQDQPHSTYLVAVAVGQFEPVLVGGDVPSTIWVRPGSADRAFVAADATRSVLNFVQAYTGVKFPWAKCDHVAVPHFTWSGMENTSLNLIRENKLVLEHKNDVAGRATVVDLLAHEISHQWFGDHVTLKWWNDAWLNEGFATWMGEKASDAYFDNDMTEVERAQSLFVGYFREEDGPRSHPLVGNKAPTAEDVFDYTAYVKGAQVLRMLELWVGPAEVKASVKAYLEKFGGANATSADFFQVVAQTTKKASEVKAFQEAWLKKKGYPVLFPEASYEGGKLTLTVRQQPNQASEKGPFVFRLPVVIHRETEPRYTQEVVLTVDKPTVTLKVDVPAAPGWINWNKDAGALARINPSSVSEEQWIDAARYDPDPVWRTLAAWTLAGEMVAPAPRAETIPTDAAMGALKDVLTRDPSPYVREALLDRLAESRWKRLPAALGPTVLALAQRPTDLPEDAVGLVRVGLAAREALGKVDFPDGHKWLLEELGKREVDLNYLSGLAWGAARIGTPVALATLRAAVQSQGARGEAWHRRAAVALGAYPGPEVLPVLRDTFRQHRGNAALLGSLTWAFSDNPVRFSADAVGLVKDLVLDEQTLEEDARLDLLSVLDEVKTAEAKDALTQVAAKSSSARLQGVAKQVLQANFGGKAGK